MLPGKLVTLFDVRLQQWRAIDYIAQAKQNGMEEARALLGSVKLGVLRYLTSSITLHLFC